MARPFADELPPYYDLVEQHQAIIEAIKESNSKQAVKELSLHINSLSFKS